MQQPVLLRSRILSTPAAGTPVVPIETAAVEALPRHLSPVQTQTGVCLGLGFTGLSSVSYVGIYGKAAGGL